MATATSPRKALVTGPVGFVGSNVTARLIAEGWQVTLFGRNLANRLPTDVRAAAAELIEGSIEEEGKLITAAKGTSAIFHCAALVGSDLYSTNPADTMDVEALGLRNICHAALQADRAMVVYPSSSAIYGGQATGQALSETQPPAPQSSYAVAKRFNELYLEAQFRQNQLRSVALRIFNVYGPHQHRRMVIPKFIAAALEGQPLLINGDGRQVRDFVYIDDVVDAMVKVCDLEPGNHILNVASGTGHSVREVAEMILAMTESKSGIEHRALPEHRLTVEVDYSIGDATAAQRRLRLSPPISLAQGIRGILDVERLTLAP